MIQTLITAVIAIMGALILFFDVKSEKNGKKRITPFGLFFISVFSLGIFANAFVGHHQSLQAAKKADNDSELITGLRKQVTAQADIQNERTLELRDIIADQKTELAEQSTKLDAQAKELKDMGESFSILVEENSKLSKNYTKLSNSNVTLLQQNSQLSQQVGGLGGQLYNHARNLEVKADELNRLTNEQNRLTKDELNRQERCRRMTQFSSNIVLYGCEDFKSKQTNRYNYRPNYGYTNSQSKLIISNTGRPAINLGGGLYKSIDD